MSAKKQISKDDLHRYIERQLKKNLDQDERIISGMTEYILQAIIYGYLSDLVGQSWLIEVESFNSNTKKKADIVLV